MKKRLLFVLLVSSLLSVSLLPLIGARARPASGAATGVLTISDQSFTQVDGATQVKAFFSVTAPHNFVGVEVKDADLNIHTALPGNIAIPGIPGLTAAEIIGVGGTANYQLSLQPESGKGKSVADLDGDGLVSNDIKVWTLQDGTQLPAAAVSASTGALTLTSATPTEIPNPATRLGNTALTGTGAMQVGLSTAMTAIGRLKVTVTLSSGAQLAHTGVQITGTRVDPVTLGTTASYSETIVGTVYLGIQGTTAFITAAFFAPTPGPVVTVNVSTTGGAGSVLVGVEELATVVATYQTDVVETLPGVAITSSTATALGFVRTMTFTETSASSGIFRATVRLVRDTANPCFPPIPTADVPGCETAITLGDNKYFGGLIVKDGDTITVTYNDASNASDVAEVATATAMVDLTPPSLTVRSPADGSSTNVSNITFSVDVTDAAAGVDGSPISSGATPASTVFGGLPGTPAVLQPVSKSPIANGFNLTTLATGVADAQYNWYVTTNIKDLVGNSPKAVNDVDKSVDFCGNNAVKGTSGNRWTAAVGATKPALASARTGVGGLIDTRLQEAGVVTYPDVPSLRTADPLGPRPGQPVNCVIFGKLTDDVNVNTVKVATVAGDPGFGAGITHKFVSDAAKASTANTSLKVVARTAAGGRMGLDQNSIAASDFTVGGINPSKADLGPMVPGVGQVVYLTMPIRFATDATPPVEVAGPIADAAGNTLDPATLTQAERDAGIHRAWAADGLAPVLALGLAIAGDQATITLTASEALVSTPAVSVCNDANANNRCDTAENAVALTMSLTAANQYRGSYALQPGDLGLKKVVAFGVDVAGNVGKAAQVLGTGPTRISLQAPTVVRPGEDFSVSAQVLLLPSLNMAANAGMPVLFNHVVYGLQSGSSQSGSTTVNTNAQGEATLVMTAPMETSVILVDAVFLDWGGLRASSNMWIVSVLPIVNARLTANSSGGNIVFTLQDAYGNAMAGRTLTFLSTAGNLSVASGVTDATGQVSLTLSDTTEAVVSASFGGWVSPQGWAYQPTMARTSVVVG